MNSNRKNFSELKIMKQPKTRYSNAGVQTQQAFSELARYADLAPDAFVTLKTVSLVLGINRNSVVKTPLQPTLIDKRKCFRKDEVTGWALHDIERPDSILRKLQEEQQHAIDRMRKEKSRRYGTDSTTGEELREAKARSAANRDQPFSVDEIVAGWDRRRTASKNRAPLPAKYVGPEEPVFDHAWAREELKKLNR